MLKKIRSLAYQYVILAVLVIEVVFKLLYFGLKQFFLLFPQTQPVEYLCEIVLMLVPVAFVFIFGFSSTFKKGNFRRALICCLPFILQQLLIFGVFFSEYLGNPEANWRPWYLMVLGVFSIFGVGVREECIYRATIQNLLAKKYANSVKGIWITVGVASVIFGLTHATNLLYGVAPIAVLSQVITATAVGVLFGAVYLRSGSIWALILIHTLTDVAGLAKSTFLYRIDAEVISELSLSWGTALVCAVYIGLAAFLLRPSTCKQVYESLCFAGEPSEAALHT